MTQVGVPRRRRARYVLARVDRPIAFLLRPHPFLVDTMSRYMESIGFTPLRSTAAADLAAHASRGLGVISLAVIADAPLTIAQAYATWTKYAPARTLLFSGLASKDSAQTGLSNELGPKAPQLVRPVPGVTLQAGEAPYVVAADLAGAAATTLTDWLKAAVAGPRVS